MDGGNMPENYILWDPVNYLNTKLDVCYYLAAAVEDDSGDGKLVRAVVDDIARALDEKGLKHKFDISGDELREAISKEESLSFTTISHIAQALGMKLTATTADPPPEEICYRTVSKEEAQGEILELLAVEPDLCYDDISDKLRIEMEMVVDICIELEDEGVIKVDAC